MKKYNYIRLSKTKKLRYMGNFFKKKLYIIFLPGFMSNIEGEKPKAFKRYAVKKKLGYLTLDYSGHGKSSGKFTKGNISQWSNDTKILIRRFIKKNKAKYSKTESKNYIDGEFEDLCEDDDKKI